MKQIHVLHILNSAHGGSAISTFELIEALSERGVKSSLVCFNNASSDQQHAIQRIVDGRVMFIPLYWMNKRIRSAWWKRPIIEIKSLLSTYKGHRYQSQIRDFIRNHGVNVIHSSTILNPEGAFAARQNSLPHVWHVRELIGPDNHFHFYNYKKWSQFVLDHCARLVANSSVTEQCLLKYFPCRKVVCISNGIRISTYNLKVHTNSKPKVLVGMIGNLTTRWKNHEFFVRVSAFFIDRTDVEFRIYGAIPDTQDSYYNHIAGLARSLKVDNVLRFIPFRKPQEIVSEIDILFHPSEFESFGRIFVEAMAGGIPVVAVRAGGALEIITDSENGFLIDKGDYFGARDAISRLIDDAELRNRYGENGRGVVEGRYTLDKLADNVVQLYNEVM